MITWGFCSAAFALIGDRSRSWCCVSCSASRRRASFQGVILFLTYWYPASLSRDHRRYLHGGDSGRGLIGSRFSGAILYIDGILASAGGQ